MDLPHRTVGARGPVGLKPGKSMTVEYELNAPGPTEHEDITVSAPARTEFSAERYGPVCTRDHPSYLQSTSSTTEESSVQER